MNSNRTVLISGAGTAGPALAYWLLRHGFVPTVVERAPALREGGYKVDIRGAAVTVTERMGLLAKAKAAGTDMREGLFVSHTGTRLATMAGDTVGFRGSDDLEIMRGDLTTLLHQATRDDVEYHFGDSITSLSETSDGVHATFHHATPKTFDLVIGADGQHSTTRALAFGEASRFVRDLGGYICVFTVPNHLGLDRQEVVYHAGNGRLVNLYSTRGDTEAKAGFWFRSPPLDYDPRDIGAQQRLVSQRYAGARWETRTVLGWMDSAPDFYFDSMSQVRMDRWSTGRVALVGDAAYGASAASGQGTSMALVGAYVLAGELATAADHRAAFAGYERQMREYVARNQRLANSALKGLLPNSPLLAWFIPRYLGLLQYLPGKNMAMEQVHKPVRKAANAITLKDYPHHTGR
jgi:2-polyprenyl-6-methoxyphenol hydroxylase-like FAD-dependent oxidoreductase